MLRKRLETVRRAGVGYAVLYSLLLITIVVIVVDAFFEILTNVEVIRFVAVVVLTILGELLYFRLEERHSGIGDVDPARAGIVGALPNLKGLQFESLMSRPGKKWIVNTWLVNFERLVPCLESALEHAETVVDIITLAPQSTHARQRSAELQQRSVESAIETSLDDLSFFLGSLPKHKQGRVKIFEFDDVPKFTIYGCCDDTIVGFFWPGQYAAHGPQLLVRGDEGFFAKQIRDYYLGLEKREVTQKVLARLRRDKLQI